MAIQNPRVNPRKRRSSNYVGAVVIGVTCALLMGCRVGPDYTPPEVKMPDQWDQALAKGLAEGEASLETWWNIFEDPTLTRLIDLARMKNLDLKTAVARILEARAELGIASGERYPVVDATGDYRRTRQSKDILPVLPPGASRTDDSWSIGLDDTARPLSH